MTEPLSRTERALLRLAAHQGRDRFLEDLAQRAERGMFASVGLLINGMVVVGGLTSAKEVAEGVDRHREIAIAIMERRLDELPDNWGEFRERTLGEQVRDFESHLAELEQLNTDAHSFNEEQGSATFDPAVAPAELAERFYALVPRTHLTLNQVHIAAPNVPKPHHVPVLRVRIDQIAAWWLIEMDEEGHSSFKLFDGSED